MNNENTAKLLKLKKLLDEKLQYFEENDYKNDEKSNPYSYINMYGSYNGYYPDDCKCGNVNRLNETIDLLEVIKYQLDSILKDKDN